MPDSDRLIAQSHLDLNERIRKRAHEIWLSKGGSGEDTALDDWLEAEREILGEFRQPAQDSGTTVGKAGRSR
ncbi:MAG TPA: DUF2934 domain-containing protein [Bryobacteraceae bacterium]|nr:DUF2934 domain-containing protein [Bryobacteraceae bacterium]